MLEVFARMRRSSTADERHAQLWSNNYIIRLTSTSQFVYTDYIDVSAAAATAADRTFTVAW